MPPAPRPTLPVAYRLLGFAMFGGVPGLFGLLLYIGAIPSHRSPRCVATFCDRHWTMLAASLALLCIGLLFLVPRRWPGLWRGCALGAVAGFLASLAGSLFTLALH